MVLIKDKEKTNRCPIFAYLRRSTSKTEQSESLIQQEDGIDSIVKKLWFEKENIMYFAETYSGFENKKRKKWWEMIKEIDRAKEPCILITRDLSRLSRNPTDSLEIMNRLYGDNKNKRKIDKIIYLDYEMTKEITKEFDKEELHKKLSAWYYDSLDTRRKSIWWIILKLEKGEFPYRAPKGLDNYVVTWKRILKQNDKMPFVVRAFEMKAEWKNHKEISKYLLKYGDIKLSDRELSDRLFKNTVYIGEYTEKNTGLYFNSICFFEWKAPINLVLWEKVQKSLWRKISQYWEWQYWDILAGKLRTENGKRMSKYLAKGKYPNYKNTIEKIHISEKVILRSFVEHITIWLRNAITEHESNAYIVTDNKKANAIFEDLFLIKWVTVEEKEQKALLYNTGKISEEEYMSIWKVKPDTKENRYAICSRYKMVLKESWLIQECEGEFINFHQKMTFAYIKLGLLQKYKDQNLNEIKFNANKIADLITKKEDIENEIISFSRSAIKMGYSKDLTEKAIITMQNDIKRIENDIQIYSENSDTEKYLKRLPEVLWKIFELMEQALFKEDLIGIEDDLLKLIDLTTFELTVNEKKELKIKLFDIFVTFTFDKSDILEAPSGVEPDYKALQASA